MGSVQLSLRQVLVLGLVRERTEVQAEVLVQVGRELWRKRWLARRQVQMRQQVPPQKAQAAGEGAGMSVWEMEEREQDSQRKRQMQY